MPDGHYEPGYPEEASSQAVQEEIAAYVAIAPEVAEAGQQFFAERGYTPLPMAPKARAKQEAQMAAAAAKATYNAQAAAKRESRQLAALAPGEESLTEMYTSLIYLLFILLMFQMMR